MTNPRLCGVLVFMTCWLVVPAPGLTSVRAEEGAGIKFKAVANQPERRPEQAALTVRVDPRIELLSIVQFLSGYGDLTGLITRYKFAYKQEIKRSFSQFKNHSSWSRSSAASRFAASISWK